MKDRIQQIRAHLIGIDEILCTLEEELEKESKAKIEIKFGQDTSYSDNMDELIKKFSKDLEEMLNDFTEKREN